MGAFFNRSLKICCIFFALLLPGQSIFPEEFEEEDTSQQVSRSIPNMLRRPDRGESPRFPRDLIIGELGRGDASVGAYSFASNLLSALVEGNREARIIAESRSALSNMHFEEISGIRTRNFRIGGGRIEPDGNVSFLVRFIGLEESISGELFLRSVGGSDDGAEGIWRLDDLILEERRLLREIRDSYRYDFSPYERFY